MKQERFFHHFGGWGFFPNFFWMFFFFLFLLPFSPTPLFAGPSPTIPDQVIVHSLPEKTDIFFQCTSLEKLYNTFSITKDRFWGYPIDELKEIESELGFNPFDLEALKANGVDVERPLAVSISDLKMAHTIENAALVSEESVSEEASSSPPTADEEEPYLNLILFLPAKNEAKAMSWIKQSIEKKNASAKFEKIGETWKWTFENKSSTDQHSPTQADGGFASINQARTEVQEQAQTNANETSSASPSVDETMTEETKSAETSSNSTDTVLGFPSYMTTGNGYVLMGTNPGEDVGPFFDKIATRLKDFGNPMSPGLSDKATFKKVVAKLDPGMDLLFYMDFERLIKEDLESMAFFSFLFPGGAEEIRELAEDPSTHASLELIKDYSAMGAAMDLDSPDFKAGFFVDVKETSKLYSLFKDVPVKRDIVLGMKEHPVLLWGLTQQMQAYWQMIRETFDKNMLAEMTHEFAQIKEEYGIDIESDIIANLGNNFNAGIYDGMSINMSNVNALVSIEFKDPDKMLSVINTFIESMPQEKQMMVNQLQLNGSLFFMVPIGPVQIYAGFKGNQLIVTLGKPMVEKALAADLSKGFTATLNVNDKALKDSLSREHSVTYLNFMELYYIVKNFFPMLMQGGGNNATMVMTSEFQKIVSLFEYLSLTFNAASDGFMGDVLIKTHFDKPFFKGAKEVTDQIDAMRQTM